MNKDFRKAFMDAMNMFGGIPKSVRKDMENSFKDLSKAVDEMKRKNENFDPMNMSMSQANEVYSLTEKYRKQRTKK